MDIKPYQTPDINWLTVSWPAWILLGIAVVVVAIGTKAFFKTGKSGPFVLFLVGILVLTPSAAGIFGAAYTDILQTAYANKVSELKTSLSADGFNVINGTPNLHANSKSELVLQHHGRAFECILYTPEDVKMNVLFSCGETGLGLEEIKGSKS